MYSVYIATVGKVCAFNIQATSWPCWSSSWGWEGAHYNSLGDEVFGLVAIAVVFLDFAEVHVLFFKDQILVNSS